MIDDEIGMTEALLKQGGVLDRFTLTKALQFARQSKELWEMTLLIPFRAQQPGRLSRRFSRSVRRSRVLTMPKSTADTDCSTPNAM